jgi:hypothetical protein
MFHGPASPITRPNSSLERTTTASPRQTPVDSGSYHPGRRLPGTAQPVKQTSRPERRVQRPLTRTLSPSCSFNLGSPSLVACEISIASRRPPQWATRPELEMAHFIHSNSHVIPRPAEVVHQFIHRPHRHTDDMRRFVPLTGHACWWSRGRPLHGTAARDNLRRPTARAGARAPRIRRYRCSGGRPALPGMPVSGVSAAGHPIHLTVRVLWVLDYSMVCRSDQRRAAISSPVLLDHRQVVIVRPALPSGRR